MSLNVRRVFPILEATISNTITYLNFMPVFKHILEDTLLSKITIYYDSQIKLLLTKNAFTNNGLVVKANTSKRI